MNSLQIRKYIEQEICSYSKFGDIIPADALSELEISKDRFYVVNTKPSTHPGEHWIVIYINNSNSIEFWDSLGKNPESYSVYFQNFFIDKV